MQLLSIQGENFGVLHEKSLSFSSGLQIVYGPNEAGKSTLLRLVRETLFGFPFHKHSLQWQAGGVSSRAKLELRDGRTLILHRQKGRPDEITGHWESGNLPFDGAQLNTVLQGASEQVFSNLFAFSLRELIDGEESLQRAGLGESLFSGGWGGLERYRAVQTQLATERERWFKPRGRSQVLHKMIVDLQDHQREYQETLVPQHELERVQAELAQLNESVAEIEAEVQATRQSLRQTELLEQAVPLWHAQRVLEAECQELDLPEKLTGDCVEDLHRLRDRLADVEDEIFSVTQQSTGQQHPQDLTLTPLQTAIRSHERAVRELEQQLSQQRQIKEQLPQWQQELAEVERRLEHRLANLEIGWSTDEIATRKIGLAQRDILANLLRESRQLRERLSAVRARRPDVQQLLQVAQEHLALLPPPRSMAELADLLERGDHWREQHRNVEFTQRQLDILAEELRRLSEQQLRRLASAGGTLLAEVTAQGVSSVDWLSLPTPCIAQVEDAREQLQGAQAAVAKWTHNVEQVQEELNVQRRDLGEFDRLYPQLNREQLLELRQQRNAGWDLIRTQMRDGRVDEAALHAYLRQHSADDLPELFERLLLEADRVADHQLVQADSFARREQLNARIERLEVQLKEHVDTLQANKQRLEACVEEWKTMWAPAGIAPGSANAMLDWLQPLEPFRSQQRDSERKRSEVIQLEAANSKFILELAQTFPQHPDPHVALREARLIFEAAERAEGDRRRLNTEISTLQARFDQLEQQEREINQPLNEIETGRLQFLREHQFPTDWTLETADLVLRALAESQSDLRIQRQLSTEINQAQLTLQMFADKVQTIAQQVDSTGEKLVSGSSVATLQQLAQELEAAHTTELKRAQQLAAANEAARKLADLKQVIQLTRDRLNDVRQRAGLSVDADLATVLSQYVQRQQLEHKLSETRIRLQQVSPDIAALLATVRDTSLDELQQRHVELTASLKLQTEQHRQELERVGALRKQLMDWSQQNRADRLANRLESLRSDFVQGVDQWAALTLAEAMMQRSLKRFEELHQPRLLKAVGKWLQRLTRGRYSELQQNIDQPDEIRVIDARGMALRPDELSTGTREQLFLAIRLAYVADYARAHDPLPMVLDDVLVNFDDERARETLLALQEFAADCQVLLLTCHDRMIQLNRSLPVPGAEMHLNPSASPPSALTSVRESVAQVEPSSGSPQQRKRQTTTLPGRLFPNTQDD